MNRRKVMIVTGTRAEYGLLYWVMREIEAEPELDMQLVVTGAHLSPDFGMTYRLIEEDGFRIDEKLDMLLSNDSPTAVTKSVGLAVIGFADVLARLKPDIALLIGDRFEMFAAAQAAMINRIPIAHIHGGEVTEGAIDEAIRHSITKMSHIHFVAAEPYRQRVIQLGENKDFIYNFGAPGVENIKRLKLLSRLQLEEAIDFPLGPLTFLVTYHPVTLEGNGPRQAMEELTAAFEHFPEAHIIFTKPNSDADGKIIIEVMNQYAEKHPDRVRVFASMGQINYLSALRFCDVVIGNSSSGIIEAPIFQKPTINIGSRQNGRLKASSIIDCTETSGSIIEAIGLVMSLEFQAKLSSVEAPYGDGDTAVNIKNCLKSVNLQNIINKKFYDM